MPSTIRLTSYLELPPKPDTSKPYELSHVQTPHGVVVPQHALVTLYGTRWSMKEIGKVHRHARENNLEVYRANIEVDIGAWIPAPMGPEDMERTAFLNLSRIKIDLRADIEKALREVSTKLKMPIVMERIKEHGVVSTLGRWPSYYDLLMQHPQFSHVAAASFDTEDARGTLNGRFAALYDADAVIELEALGEEEISICLPESVGVDELARAG